MLSDTDLAEELLTRLERRDGRPEIPAHIPQPRLEATVHELRPREEPVADLTQAPAGGPRVSAGSFDPDEDETDEYGLPLGAVAHRPEMDWREEQRLMAGETGDEFDPA